MQKPNSIKPIQHFFEMELLKDKYAAETKYPIDQRCEEDCRFIYVFINPVTGLCKIGITNNPRTRISQISNSSGMKVKSLIELELQVDYDEPPKYIEDYLHRYFKAKRKTGEWFDLSVRDIVQIRQLFWQIEGIMIWDYVKENIHHLQPQLKTTA